MDALEYLKNRTPFLWINDYLEDVNSALPKLSLGMNDMRDVQARLYRFAPVIAELFAEETGNTGGIIESELKSVPNLARYLKIPGDFGNVYLKEDHNLPIAGSVKARGGIYEVLFFAEQLAIENSLLDYKDNYLRLLDEETKKLFAKYTISVGSTGNLGLSIGIISSALGFNVDIHMSFEAKEWKKKRLRDRGVNVIEHKTDYSSAVESGRKAAEKNEYNFFVDDENSVQLFMGYSVAAFRLKKQLDNYGIRINTDNPLFVYLPCGIGGAPGGITFGLKQIFGDAVHCFFAEPVDAPCMTLGLVTGKHSNISVYDIGLSVKTDADGLAVSRPSGFVGELVAPILNGSYTIDDPALYKYVYAAYILEKMKIEPSAAAGFIGPEFIFNSESGSEYLNKCGLAKSYNNITHILWTTGGKYVPETEYAKFLEIGKSCF